MGHIPHVSGYSPVRWQKGIDVMLERKKGNFRVDKLHPILLYEANFNQSNKKLGRDMMYIAEQLQVVAKELYWSRKNKAAIEQCLNKRLTFDFARQLKRPLAMCSNDAKSCYDRIVHSVASLCMRRVGVEEPPIVCMFTTIQNPITRSAPCTAIPSSHFPTNNGRCLSKGLVKEMVPVRKSRQLLVPPSSTCYGTKGTGPTFGQLSLVLRSALSATHLWTTRICVLPVNILMILKRPSHSECSYLGKRADSQGSPLSPGPSYKMGSYTCSHYGRRLRDCRSYSRWEMRVRERRFLQ
jgi:hypothetical protein